MVRMYMAPRNRMAPVRYNPNTDRIVRNAGIESDVHVPMDIRENKESYEIIATVPGLDAENLEIEVIRNTVTISGEFAGDDDEDITYLRQERPIGKFRRMFRFGDNLDAENTNASLVNGILSLEIAKVPEALPKTINVTVAK